jgi:hypothetical protein
MPEYPCSFAVLESRGSMPIDDKEQQLASSFWPFRHAVEPQRAGKYSEQGKTE